MVSVCCRNLVAVVLLVGWGQLVAAGQEIKQSSSGICHPPESSYYERTRSYTAFASLEACLESGGRLPRALQGSRQKDSSDDGAYSRSHFGHGWDDADGDCQDSRAEALITTSSTRVRFADTDRCRVVTGRWISPFTGAVIQNAGNIDIDHVVPLALAWERGARDWSRTRREAFANDPVNLWPVEAGLNRSKGARGPDQWLPPAAQCQYASRFVRITRLYDLKPRSDESASWQALLRQC